MSSSFFLKGKNCGKRKVEITFGLYFNFSRMCNWNRECMEIRLYGRPRWWRIFVLLYLLFLVMLGIPIMSMEFAVGRASQKSPAQAYKALEKAGQNGIFTDILL